MYKVHIHIVYHKRHSIQIQHTRQKMIVEHSSQSNDPFMSIIAEVTDNGFSETLLYLHKHITQLAHTVAVFQCVHCEGVKREE